MRGLPALALGLAAVAVVWACTVQGDWWLTTVVGLVLGVAVARASLALPMGLTAGALGWGLPLAALARSTPAVSTGAVLAGMLGVRATGAPAVVLTVLVGALLGLSGAWVGAALRGLRAWRPA